MSSKLFDRFNEISKEYGEWEQEPNEPLKVKNLIYLLNESIRRAGCQPNRIHELMNAELTIREEKGLSIDPGQSIVSAQWGIANNNKFFVFSKEKK